MQSGQVHPPNGEVKDAGKAHPCKIGQQQPAGGLRTAKKRHGRDQDRKGRTRFVLISPREREEFMRELAEAVPGLELDADRLVREKRHE